MKIKKYIASSMNEAMLEIRKELGADAVILSSKEIKTGGFLGLFQKKNIEVIAAIEKTPAKIEGPEEKIPKIKVQPKVKHEENKQQKQILAELQHMKKLLVSQTTAEETNFPAVYANLMHYFIQEQEVTETIAHKIVENIYERTKDMEELSEKQMIEYAKDEIESQIDHIPFHTIRADKKIIQFVGPTGVGKTTTLAKIAANTMLEQKKKVAFITTDTYRIAAIDQLKTYARILDVPVEVAYSIDDYEAALKQFDAYDYIFVDTAGRNFRDDRYVLELKGMLPFEENKVDTYLVLSLTAKNSDILDIYEQFSNLDIHKVIFTKMDETITYGSILNLLIEKNVDLAYMTNGQDVPDDLIKPSKQSISKLMVSRYQQ